MLRLSLKSSGWGCIQAEVVVEWIIWGTEVVCVLWTEVGADRISPHITHAHTHARAHARTHTHTRLRGHRKSSQKPTETNKISFTWNPLSPPWNEQKFALQASTLRPMCIQNTIWSLKCDFFENPHPLKWILFVSQGFCKLLRWSLTPN